MKKSNIHNHIELFAGCGGLTLGLERAGFELVLANELSPMAAETFAYNFFNEDLAELAQKSGNSKRSFWLSSKFKELSLRLRENPFEFPEYSRDKTDIPDEYKELKGGLIVGSIVELNRLLDNNKELLREIKSGFGNNGIDLVSGGPPCQGFSMAGLRKKDSDKNILPWEFASFVSKIQPKIAVLENVTGILRAFKDENGNSFHAWFEVAKVFAMKKYIPLCLHVNARLVGVPQNRPRFIMIAVREDIFNTLSKMFVNNLSEKELFKKSKSFYDKMQSDTDSVKFGSLPYFDVMKPEDFNFFKNSFLKHFIGKNEVSVKDAIDDLKICNPSQPSDFVKCLNNTFEENLSKNSEILNNDHRRNSPLVKSRFRLYQILQECSSKIITKEIFEVLKGNSKDISDKSWDELKKYSFLDEHGKDAIFLEKNEFIRYLGLIPTKKQTQKALVSEKPAPAALSIPDDACHYDHQELRVLTVREMARIQSFPDNFVFRSKVTTGGQMRKFEVPQYTQVGNAVPPLLGLAIGLSINELLEMALGK